MIDMSITGIAMENMAVVQILFAGFAVAFAGLMLANVLVVLLRVSHRGDIAAKLAKDLRPFVSYLRLGGDSEKKSRHA